MIATLLKNPKPKQETRARLIEATARLFSLHGYNGLTLRSVAKEANANLAAANYHFGSKDALVLEMLRERIQPINQRRLQLLEEEKNKRTLNKRFKLHLGSSIYICVIFNACIEEILIGIQP